MSPSFTAIMTNSRYIIHRARNWNMLTFQVIILKHETQNAVFWPQCDSKSASSAVIQEYTSEAIRVMVILLVTMLTILALCLSTNGERVLSYTIVKRLIWTTNTHKFLNYVYKVKGIQCHSNPATVWIEKEATKTSHVI